jgi:hypothetical protein
MMVGIERHGRDKPWLQQDADWTAASVWLLVERAKAIRRDIGDLRGVHPQYQRDVANSADRLVRGLLRIVPLREPDKEQER